MATSDDFKEKLKAGKIVDALTLALGESVELEITTWVCSANSKAETSAEADPTPSRLPNAYSYEYRRGCDRQRSWQSVHW